MNQPEVKKDLFLVWAEARSKHTAIKFDPLRLDIHIHSLVQPEELPPNPSVIRGHIKGAFFIIRNAFTLLYECSAVDPIYYGLTN